MDALVIHAAGDLRVKDVPTPALEAGQMRARVRFGGICGSDLHCYQHGGFGTVRVQEPMVPRRRQAADLGDAFVPRPGRAFALAADRSQAMKVLLDSSAAGTLLAVARGTPTGIERPAPACISSGGGSSP